MASVSESSGYEKVRNDITERADQHDREVESLGRKAQDLTSLVEEAFSTPREATPREERLGLKERVKQSWDNLPKSAKVALIIAAVVMALALFAGLGLLVMHLTCGISMGCKAASHLLANPKVLGPMIGGVALLSGGAYAIRAAARHYAKGKTESI